MTVPRFLALALLSLSMTSLLPAIPVTVGDHDPVVDNGGADGWDAIFIFNTPLVGPTEHDTAGQVTQMEFWADFGTGGRTITPLLFESTDGGATHVTIGAGTTYEIGEGDTNENSANSVPFGLLSGTDRFDTATEGSTYYIGFHTTDGGGNAGATGGVVPFAGGGGGSNILWQTETTPSVDQDPSVGASANYRSNRSYSYNFDLDFTRPDNVDSDSDGLGDLFEQRIIDADPDDGLVSFADVKPEDDFDHDNSTNAQESERGTDPTNSDSDDDSIIDGYETDTGTFVDIFHTGTSPLLADTDNDGIGDGMENNSGIFLSPSNPGTNPNKRDTDGDGLNDGVETNDGVFVDSSATGTDPNNPDSDDDLAYDGEELAVATDPNDPTSGAINGMAAGQQEVAFDQDVADSWAICYVDEQRSFRLRGGTSNALTFNFFASSDSIGAGGRVTPFIAEVIAPNDFIVRAIGTTRIEGIDWTAAGLQSFPFHDDETPEIGDGWVAGFITSDPDGSNASNQIVPYRGNAGIDGWLAGSGGPEDPGGIALGEAPQDGLGATNHDAYGFRDYSFQILVGKAEGITLLAVAHDPDENITELTWTSQAGELFEIRKSLDLAADPVAWEVVRSALPASDAPATTTTALVDDDASESTAFYKVFKIVPPPLFEEDFESGRANWTTHHNDVTGGTRWELGSPTLVGPIEAHSLSNCFGTDLDDNYADGLDNAGTGITLRSPAIDLQGATTATLEYWHYYDFGLDDLGNLHFLDASGNLIETASISPVKDFLLEWEKVRLPLPAAVIASGEVILEWEFLSATDAQENYAGWYIDDVSVTR